MAHREVVEADFRMPEYRDAKVEDFERRADGKLVRKDRWQTGMHHVASILSMNGRGGFEIDEVVAAVKKLVDAAPLARCEADCDGDCEHPKCPQLADGEPVKSGRHCPLDVADQSRAERCES